MGDFNLGALAGDKKKPYGVDPDTTWYLNQQTFGQSNLSGSDVNAISAGMAGVTDHQIRNPNAVAEEQGALDPITEHQASIGDFNLMSPTTWLAPFAALSNGVSGNDDTMNSLSNWLSGNGSFEDVKRSFSGQQSIEDEEEAERKKNVVLTGYTGGSAGSGIGRS